jgi:hypothetical protein
MMRRALFLIPLALCLAADPAQEVLDLVTGMAASLSAGNAREFLAAFDPAMPGYQQLRENVNALTRQEAVESFVDVASDEGDAQKRTVQLNWRMRLKRNSDATASTGREQVLKCRFEKQGRKWRITALEPVDFFAPDRKE